MELFSACVCCFKKEENSNRRNLTEVRYESSILFLGLFLKPDRLLTCESKKNFSRVFLCFFAVISHEFVRFFFKNIVDFGKFRKIKGLFFHFQNNPRCLISINCLNYLSL